MHKDNLVPQLTNVESVTKTKRNIEQKPANTNRLGLHILDDI